MSNELIKALSHESLRIQAEFENSKLFTHNGTVGQFRENIISKLLRPHIPDCYSIGTGQVFDKAGNKSCQLDIVLYDQLFSTVLFKGQDNLLLPFESVYGSVEVKSTLNANELKNALGNAASLRRLTRAPSNSGYFFPHFGSMLSEDPSNLIQFDKRQANLPLNIILAYDGIESDTCNQKLNEHFQSIAAEDRHLMPDFIFNLKRQYMITKGEVTPGGWLLALREFRGPIAFDGYFAINCGDRTLAMFFLTLNSFLNKIRLNALNPVEYWNQVFRELLNQSKAPD
jgi:hypothetical protein